jgi:hypothetical protein
MVSMAAISDDGGSTDRAERWVAWGSAACAVHCAASPALVVLLPLLAWGEVVERGLILALMPLAAWVTWRGVRRHGQWGPVLPVTAGILCWLVALPEAHAGVQQAIIVGAGGAFTFGGVQWSQRLARPCECVSCDISQINVAGDSEIQRSRLG